MCMYRVQHGTILGYYACTGVSCVNLARMIPLYNSDSHSTHPNVVKEQPFSNSDKKVQLSTSCHNLGLHGINWDNMGYHLICPIWNETPSFASPPNKRSPVSSSKLTLKCKCWCPLKRRGQCDAAILSISKLPVCGST